MQYGDIARMLNMYQLWLDDLYPRAKFADALAIIEKVGHTKRMQVDRKAWIDEGKPRNTTEQDEDDREASVPQEVPQPDREEPEGDQAPHTSLSYTELVSRLPAQAISPSRLTSQEPDEEELDALLADGAQPEISQPKVTPTQSGVNDDDPFADEMEAMEGMEDMW